MCAIAPPSAPHALALPAPFAIVIIAVHYYNINLIALHLWTFISVASKTPIDSFFINIIKNTWIIFTVFYLT
jgi:hypothetical protein